MQAKSASMDASDEIAIDFSPILRVYRDGRVERLDCTKPVPPSVDLVSGIASKDVVIHPGTGVSARLYRPNASTAVGASKLPVLVYFHGGGFCIESAFTSLYHVFLNSLVSRVGVVAVSVDYRLAPEHPLPAAYDDAWLALRWVASHAEGGGGGPEPWLSTERADFSRVFLAGDSAGANIAHNMLIRAGVEGLGGGGAGSMVVEGVMLLHPYFWGTERLPCEMGRGDGPLLPPEAVNGLWPLISGGAGNDDPRINPMTEWAPSLAGLACRRVLVAVAEKDTLRDRGKAYCEGLKKSGWEGEVQLLETTGEDHVFFLFKPGCKEANAMMNKLAGFLNEVRK